MAQDKIKLKNQLLDLKGIIRKAINLENENFDQLAVWLCNAYTNSVQ